MFSRRAQFHQSRLTEHLTGYDLEFRSAIDFGKTLLFGKGVPAEAAEGVARKMLYGQTVRQATAMGFNDAFWILSVLMICVIPLLFLMRRPEHQNGAAPPGH